MTVFLGSLQIKNFKSCVDTELHLTPITALIGRNNCGKSNCLSAMQWLVRKSKLTAPEFNDVTKPVEVTGELVGIEDVDLERLEPKHRRRIEPHVRDGKLAIRRTQNEPGGDTTLTLFDNSTSQWDVNPTGIDAAVTALFPDPIRIGAMEDAEEDASKAKTTTTIGKLLAQMLAAINERHEADLAPHISAIASLISSDGANRFEELGRIDQSLNRKIADLFPGMSVKLEFPVPTMSDLIKAGTVKVFEGSGGGRPFGSYGHGAQRAIQMAMVRHLADLKNGQGAAGGATFLLIDEPELFMHPFAIEQVREALRQLSESGYQVAFSTHSAQMVVAADAKNALLLSKSADTGTKARDRLEAVVAKLVAEPTHQLMHLFSLTNASQILFADQVVLTEGKTEARLLPGLFHAVSGLTLGQASVALVAQGGVTNTKKSMQILDALGLPSCAVVDLDYAFQHAVQHGLLAADDTDILACKQLLAQLRDNGIVTLNEAGLPAKGDTGVRASKAFQLLAAMPEARGHLDAIATKLRSQRVWLWTRGAIEPHLGLESKSESEWMAFQIRCHELSAQEACADYPSVSALVHWIVEA